MRLQVVKWVCCSQIHKFVGNLCDGVWKAKCRGGEGEDVDFSIADGKLACELVESEVIQRRNRRNSQEMSGGIEFDNSDNIRRKRCRQSRSIDAGHGHHRYSEKGAPAIALVKSLLKRCTGERSVTVTSPPGVQDTGCQYRSRNAQWERCPFNTGGGGA